jgi:hypothetical protein
MLAKLDGNQEKAAADRKADKEEMRANQAKLLATMESDREEWRVGQEKLRQGMKVWQEEIRSVRFETTNTRKETDYGLPRDGGMSRRRKANLTGQET